VWGHVDPYGDETVAQARVNVMTLNIETYIHGHSDDAALWTTLGPLFADRKVVSDLGGLPIYSVPGVRWFIAIDDGRPIGFASMRLKPDAIWYDYGYVVPDRRQAGVFAALARARDQEAANSWARQLRAVIRESRWKHYKTRGWKIGSRRGSWIHILKEPV